MADAIISIVGERVATIIEDQIRYQVNLLRGVEKKVLDLSDKLQTIRNVLDDAENRGVNNGSIKKWLKKLEDSAYEMDDILDEWNYALLKHNMGDEQSTGPVVASANQKVCCSFIPSSSCLRFKKVGVLRDTGKKIQNVKDKIDRVLKEKDEFNFVISSPTTDLVSKSWRVQSTSSIEQANVYGRDEDRDNIVRKLMISNGDSHLVMSIVGMGGIGKTTLAQLVYNDSRVRDRFEARIWICVSDPFDVDGIARGIVDSVGKEAIPQGTKQLELVLQKLRDTILGKKFLLVLDDVWTEDHNKWEPLRINLGYGAEGSVILVTTRNERVAKVMGASDSDIYRPQQLSDEECWSLLRRVSLSGRSEEECGGFEDVGKRIASKCKGLPLAVIVLGSLLQFKSSLEEWEDVLESEIWKLEKAEVELFPHLLLSYNELSTPLKRCFSYCAVYPKDSVISAERLIEEWMALGYLGSVAGNVGAEFKGREYFNNLAMRSLFQDYKKSDQEQIEFCKMHDIVHDFAQFLRRNHDSMNVSRMKRRTCKVCDPLIVSRVQEYRSLVWDEGMNPNLCYCLTCVRVLSFEHGSLSTPFELEKLIHLRWLEISGTKLSKEDLEIVFGLYFLQTLKLARCYIVEIPKEVKNLVHLRHLDLSNNVRLKALPESMCSLIELRILNVQSCSDLHELPEGINRLQNLRHLLMDLTPVRHCLPRGVGQLSGLHTLSIVFHAGSGWNKLGLLKNLTRLTGNLILAIHFRSSRDLKELVEDAREAELKNKVHIQSLSITFKQGAESSPLWMEVMEALEPHPRLKKLQIWEYGGVRLPLWISSPLNLLKEIHLFEFSEMSTLPPLGQLPSLELLYLKNLKELKLVQRLFLGMESLPTNSTAFPKLKELTFSECHKWWLWEDITEEDEESAVDIMPCLTQLNIYSCGSLKKLPVRLLRKASSSLQMLSIADSSELVKRYRDEDGSGWGFVSQYNPRLQLRLG